MKGWTSAAGALLLMATATQGLAASGVPATPPNYDGYFDLSKADAQSYVTQQLTAVGITADAYPSLYSALSAAVSIYTNADSQGIVIPTVISNAEGSDLDPVHVVVPSYSSASQTITASVSSSIPDPSYTVANTIGLYDNAAALGPIAGNITVGGTTVVSATQDKTVSGVTEYQANGVAVYVVPASELGASVQQKLGLSASDSVALALPVESSVSVSASGTDIVNTAPTDENDDKIIMLCVGRSGGNCDYSYPLSGGVEMPTIGSVTFPQAISTASSPSYDVAIWYPEYGGGCKMADSAFASSVTISGNTLSWNANPANFGTICAQYPYGATVSVTYQLSIQVQSTSNTYMTATITTDQSTAPSDTVMVLDPMYFVYGCLAEGTLITLADGTTRLPVEAVEAGQQVRGGDGRAQAVSAWWVGDQTELLRITTANGRQLAMTDTHPLPLSDGTVRLGKQLAVGDSLTTEEGPSVIVTLERIAWNGKVRNLDLGLGGRPGAALDMAAHSFFANGILVGDGRAQVTHNLAYRMSREEVAKRLPPSWQQDYESAQKRKATP